MAVVDSTTPAGDASDLERLEHLLREGSEVAFVFFADKPRGDGPVVCALEASRGARSAARIAKAVAEGLHAELALVHVPRARRWERTPARMRSWRRSHQRIAANARRVTGHARVEAVGGEGSTEQRLLAFARARDARLLVTQSGERGLDGWLARGVGASAPCPVVVVAEAQPAAGARR